MLKNLILLASLLIAASPMTMAHDPAGTPKNHCEDPSEWVEHDYGPPATGLLLALSQDGNLVGDCNGDTVPADFDGHLEWAIGGAWLDVETGDGVTGGTLACSGILGHHPYFGPVIVDDAIFGQTIPFSITADTINLIPPTDPAAPNCGDFQADESTTCGGSCSATFPPGLDGTYQVYVSFLGLVATADDPTGEAEKLMGHLFFADGGGSGSSNGHVRTGPPQSCCYVNCALGSCGICCNTGNPSCTCTLGGVPDCKCV